jgi:hypothetical protein
VVDEKRRARVVLDVAKPLLAPRALRLAVDRRIYDVAVEDEHHRHEVWCAVRSRRREPRDTSFGDGGLDVHGCDYDTRPWIR